MHTQNHYQKLTKNEIEKAIRGEGFDPLLIVDPPGSTYPPHTHPETKLLAFLQGQMEVTVKGKRYHCIPGDRIVVPGDVVHSALVGPDGCEFFWSEKMI